MNDELEATPDLVSEDPFGRGWMIKIKPSEDLGTDMMSEEQYTEFCEQE